MQVFLSRQPIFDRDERIVGYALFYREPTAADTTAADVEETPERLIVDAFLGVGLDELVGDQPAYLKVTYDMLLSGSVELLDPRRVVVEVPGDCVDDADVQATCERLKARGYRIAVDGTSQVVHDATTLGPALSWCDLVRVDVRRIDRERLARLSHSLKAVGVELLAENVENREMRDICIELGCGLFQGYEFSMPEVLVRRDLSIDHLRTFQLMRTLRDMDTTNAKIEEAFRVDLALSYKLLRMVNSASVGGRGIASIGHAIRLLGRDALYRWLALLLVTGISDSELEGEIAHTALLRGRLCELLAAPLGRPAAADTLYIVGLISNLDVLLGVPMVELVEEMDLAAEVRNALLDRSGPFGPALRLVEAYDTGRWDDVLTECRALGIEATELASLYLAALAWANDQHMSAVA